MRVCAISHIWCIIVCFMRVSGEQPQRSNDCYILNATIGVDRLTSFSLISAAKPQAFYYTKFWSGFLALMYRCKYKRSVNLWIFSCCVSGCRGGAENAGVDSRAGKCSRPRVAYVKFSCALASHVQIWMWKNNSIKYNSIIVIKSTHVWASLGWWW